MDREATPDRSLPLVLIYALAILLTGSALRAQEAPKIEQAIKAPLASKSLLLDIVRAGDKIVVVGERGHILTSADRGKSWTQADVPTRAALTGVYFHDAKLGWAVGHDSVILRTTDGGTTWNRVHWAPEDESPLMDVWFIDPNNGIAIGAYGSYLTTSDGGATWSVAPIGEEDFHLNQIARDSKGRLFLAGESGNALRSDDNGLTWKPLEVGYEGSLFGILPLEGDNVLIFGLRGHLLRSEDAGESWTAVETGSLAMLNAGVRLADGRIVIVGLGGTVLVSGDGGKTFQPVPQKTRQGIQSIVDTGSGTLILCGEFGVRELPLSELPGQGR